MTDSPWHAGERAVHDRLGERALADRMHIGNEMSDAADEFLQQQTIVYASALVGADVWVTPLTGDPGFARGSGDEEEVTVDSRPPAGDPLATALAGVTRVGMLALEPATRRRIRLNGVSTPAADGIVIALDQLYGNCPRFIQKRTPGRPNLGARTSAPVLSPSLTARQVHLLESADTFVIGTADRDGNADASHRGGSPGFVQVVDPAHFRFPDYAGNHMYMTLGNLEVRPSAGFLFVDWETGATVQVTGAVVVDFDIARADALFPDAARTVDVTVTSVVETAGRLPGSWTAPEYSRFNPPARTTPMEPSR